MNSVGFLRLSVFTAVFLSAAHYFVSGDRTNRLQKEQYKQEQEIRNLYYQLNQCRMLVREQ